MRHQRRGAAAPPAGRRRPGGALAHPPRAPVRRRACPTSPMTVLFWDIDGTLLTTAKGGMFAWDDAVKEITGRDFQLASMRIPGMTDYQIAVRTFEIAGPRPPTASCSSAWCAATRSCCPTSLPRKTGHVLPNVREILEAPARSRRRAVVSADRQHARRRQGQADALRPLDVLSRRRLCRGRARARRRSPRGRMATGAAGGPGDREPTRSSSATRRTTSTAPMPSACGPSPWRPAATRVDELRGARARGGCSTSCRRPTTSCG